MNFCLQCGTKFEPDARFCKECGFDKNTVITTAEIKPMLADVPLVIETSQSPPLNPATHPKTTEPQRFSSQPISQPVKTSEPLKQKKRMNVWIWFILILGVLGAASWFLYPMFLNSDHKSPAEIASNIIITENSNPVSLMDQELAKQKTKGQNQSKSENATNQKEIETDETSENNLTSKVLLEVGRKEEPKNKNPKNPAKLALKKPTMITRITTDHYNDGMGTPRGGMIKIIDKNNNVIGSYKAFGKTGKNGTPSAKWIAEPNIMLEKGTYFISDSEQATWSKTFIGGNGFIIVEGYEIE